MVLLILVTTGRAVMCSLEIATNSSDRGLQIATTVSPYKLQQLHYRSVYKLKLENRLQSKAIVFAWQKQSVPEGKEYSLLTARLKYRKDIWCGAELCALHL